MRKNQKGFSVIEGLLIIIALTLIAFVGYYVWHTQQQTSKTNEDVLKASQSTVPSSVSPAVKAQKATLADQSVSFIVPKDWSTDKPASICNGTDNPVQCTDSIEVAPTDVVKAKTSGAFGVSVGRYDSNSAKSAKDWLFNTWCQCVESDDWTVSTTAINGYDTVKATQSNSDYTDVYYAFEKDSTVVLISARTKEKSTSQDNTQYLPQIKALAESVQIAN